MVKFKNDNHLMVKHPDLDQTEKKKNLILVLD